MNENLNYDQQIVPVSTNQELANQQNNQQRGTRLVMFNEENITTTVRINNQQ